MLHDQWRAALMQTMTVRIPIALMGRVRQQATRTDSSHSDVVARALMAHLPPLDVQPGPEQLTLGRKDEA